MSRNNQSLSFTYF